MMDKSLIDFVLRYRYELKVAVDEEKENKDTQKVGGNGSGHCRISDPTAQKAIRHLDPVGTVRVYYGPSINGQRSSRVVHDAEKWLSVANATWEYFSKSRYGKFMQLRYGEDMEIKGVRNHLMIGRRKFFYIQKEIRFFAYKSAKGMHISSADIRKHYARTDEIMSILKERDRNGRQ